MAHAIKQNDIKSEDEAYSKMRRSFSWDKAFFTSYGFLDVEELLNVIQGDGNDVMSELQEIESLEAKLFQEIETETSTQKSTRTSKGTNSSTNPSLAKKGSQAKKITAPSSSSAPIKTVQETRSSPLSGGSGRSRGRSPARRSTSSKSGKSTPNSPSKTSIGITTKDKVVPLNTRVSRTQPVSPASPESLSSKFSGNQRSKRSSSVPRRSSVNSEKPKARSNDERKTSKPEVKIIPKTQSTISLKSKPAPVISHPSPSPCSSSTAQCRSESSSLTTCAVNQKSKAVKNRSKSNSKNRPTGQTQDQNRKQPATSRPETRSPNASKPRKLSSPKTVEAVSPGLKPISQKNTTTTTTTTTTPKPSKKQSGAKGKPSRRNSRGAENIILVSPEVMDIKGKLTALKMEISKQKNG